MALLLRKLSKTRNIFLISAFLSALMLFFIFFNKQQLSKINEMTDVFQSVITSVSIIIGFSASFYSILINLDDSYLIKRIKRNRKSRKEMQITLLSTTMDSVILLALSILLLVLIEYNILIVKIIFAIWLTCLFFLFFIVCKIMILCWLVVFGHDKEIKEKKTY